MGHATRLHRATRPQQAARARAAGTTKPRPAATAAPSPMVPLQRSIGNRAVGRLVQARLGAGRPGDRSGQPGQAMHVPGPPGSGTETGYPAIETGRCPPGRYNPDYDRDICKECLGVCDTTYPLEPCEGSKIWCEAINADALRERRRCYQETCGWRCEPCI